MIDLAQTAVGMTPHQIAASQLRLTNVSKKFGQTVVLDGVNMEIGIGERVGIVGPNGEGKSTLLRILAGLCIPDSGFVERQPETSVMCLIDSPALPPRLTVSAVLALAARLGDSKNRVEGIVDRLNLGRFRKTRCGELSTGTQRRLAVAVAVLRRPNVLALDEPFSTVDSMSRLGVAELLGEAKAMDVSVVFTDHEFGPFLDAADQGFVVRDGVVAPIPKASDGDGPQTLVRFRTNEDVSRYLFLVRASGLVAKTQNDGGNDLGVLVDASPVDANRVAVENGLISTELTAVNRQYGSRLQHAMENDDVNS